MYVYYIILIISNNVLGVCRIRGYWCSFCRIASPQDLGSKSHDLDNSPVLIKITCFIIVLVFVTNVMQVLIG